jgi:glycosyltransferase involved in cell wall biosynthesis
MSEAMALGKPVIATAYSGNVDFMTEETAHLLPWTRVPVGKDAGPYPRSATWAEPDIDAAAAAMRAVVEDPVAADAMGRRAAADLATRFSPEVTGAKMARRLAEIWSFRNA